MQTAILGLVIATFVVLVSSALILLVPFRAPGAIFKHWPYSLARALLPSWGSNAEKQSVTIRVVFNRLMRCGGMS